LLTIRRFFERQLLAHEVKTLREAMQRDPSERIIGQSVAMQGIYKTIGRVAGSDATVLISGETGTGKELVADTIHSNSTFSRGPMIKVNCAALPETLLESELFGHEKGAFTGALLQRKGRFELAHKGTIFLDEVGELSLGTQKKLLRVLQEREFERVGGSTPIKVDVRVIAATNKVLEDEVAANRFREDLFYRLNVIAIHIPPLRERKDDIPPLVEHFLHKHRYSPESPPSHISEDALETIMKHDWPGNVRELENVIERAVVMAQGRTITGDHLLFSPLTERRVIDVGRMIRDGSTLKDVLATVEKQMIVEALDHTHGNRSEAAQRLGIYRRLLYAKMREHQLMS
jgi:two-component system response regulator AtoC